MCEWCDTWCKWGGRAQHNNTVNERTHESHQCNKIIETQTNLPVKTLWILQTITSSNEHLIVVMAGTSDNKHKQNNTIHTHHIEIGIKSLHHPNKFESFHFTIQKNICWYYCFHCIGWCLLFIYNMFEVETFDQSIDHQSS